MVYFAEYYKYPVSLIDIYLPILGWFEISTILLNIRSLIKEKMFHIQKRRNSIADATFSEGSIGEPDISPVKEETREMQLGTKLFFIVAYGGIRLFWIPILVYERCPIHDPLCWMAIVLITMSAKWVYEWVRSTHKRYSVQEHKKKKE